MGKFFTKGRIACLIIFSVLVIDQIIKIWIKTHMYWHESIRITDWFYIYFTENSGMAFGMEIFAKLFLTLFRIAAVTVIGWFLYKFVKQGMKTGFIVCVSLVLTGALGNIVDSVFYGVLFNESTHSQIASFMPEGGGYAPWFHGKVVDMYYFLARMDAVCRWRTFHFLQPDIQFCGCSNQLRYHCFAVVLRQGLQ